MSSKSNFPSYLYHMGACNTSILKDPQILPCPSVSPSKCLVTANSVSAFSSINSSGNSNSAPLSISSASMYPSSTSVLSPNNCFSTSIGFNFSNSNNPHKNKMTPRGIKPNMFDVMSVLGEGGFGKVFGTVCKHNSKNYAVKVINKTKLLHHKGGIDMIYGEMKSMKKLNHPNIVSLYSVFQDKDFCYFVMDMKTGGDLRYFLKKNFHFWEEEVAFIIMSLASALDYIHSKGIIHRDVKPENIIFDSRGYPHLTDFGVAFVNENFISDGQGNSNAELTCTLASGTKQYLAPESFTKSHVHGPEIDFWSLGIVLYEIIFHKRPFEKHAPWDYVQYLEKAHYEMTKIKENKALMSESTTSNSIELTIKSSSSAATTKSLETNSIKRVKSNIFENISSEIDVTSPMPPSYSVEGSPLTPHHNHISNVPLLPKIGNNNDSYSSSKNSNFNTSVSNNSSQDNNFQSRCPSPTGYTIDLLKLNLSVTESPTHNDTQHYTKRLKSSPSNTHSSSEQNDYILPPKNLETDKNILQFKIWGNHWANDTPYVSTTSTSNNPNDLLVFPTRTLLMPNETHNIRLVSSNFSLSTNSINHITQHIYHGANPPILLVPNRFSQINPQKLVRLSPELEEVLRGLLAMKPSERWGGRNLSYLTESRWLKKINEKYNNKIKSWINNNDEIANTLKFIFSPPLFYNEIMEEKLQNNHLISHLHYYYNGEKHLGIFNKTDVLSFIFHQNYTPNNDNANINKEQYKKFEDLVYCSDLFKEFI